MWTPAASISREPKPSRWAESWLPLVTTTRARGRGQPGEGLVGQPDRVDVGERPVVDVAGDDHDVDLLALHDLEQVVDERGLVRRACPPVEGPAQVPVGGVEDAHATNLDASHRHARVAHAAGGQAYRTHAVAAR